MRRVNFLLLLVALSGCSNDQSDNREILESAPQPQNNIAAEVIPEWYTTGGDFAETHYSSLKQINKDTVSQLGFAWEYDTRTTRGLEATPLVIEGIMYTSGTWGKVYAVDARSGEEIWKFDPNVNGQVARDACCDVVNRGVAYWNGHIYVAALDGKLFALHALSGEVIWSVDTIVDHSRRYTSTGAPRIAGNVVVIGNGGAEYDVRGYVSAYDLQTSELKWRFYTVPGDPELPFEHPEMEMASKTWDPNSLWEVGGGGTVWDGMAYDPDLNLLYIGVGNSGPYPIFERSPMGGDNLFVSSIIAINPDSGRMAWYYQTTPGDSWDFTATQNMILADVDHNGQTRKVIMQAPKNGFFYVIDRETGELLSADNFAPVNWATHVDKETGKPVLTDAADYFTEPKVQTPTDAGAHGWRPMAYSPDSGLVYIPTREWHWLRLNLYPEGYKFEPGKYNIGSLNFPAYDAVIEYYEPKLPYPVDYLKQIVKDANPPDGTNFLRAWDPVTQQVAWEIQGTDTEDVGGILTTGGDLVIAGWLTGHLKFYDAETGDLLHEIDTGSSIMAAPMTYTLDNEQYIAVMAGLGGAASLGNIPQHAAAYERVNNGRILAFKIGGGDTPKPPMRKAIPVPQPPEQHGDEASIKAGHKLFLDYCDACHNNNEISLLPDLRRLTAEKHGIFNSIVLDGAFVQLGMPRFEDLTVDDAEAIHAYLINETQLAFEQQQLEQ